MTTARYAPGTVVLLAGTKRGLFTLSSTDRKTWNIDQYSLDAVPVYNAIWDQRTGRMFATDNNVFFGSKLMISDDMGENWREPEKGIAFSEESGRKLERIWIIEPGRVDEPDTIYAGVDPASLWVSHDRGETWNIVEGLENH